MRSVVVDETGIAKAPIRSHKIIGKACWNGKISKYKSIISFGFNCFNIGFNTWISLFNNWVLSIGCVSDSSDERLISVLFNTGIFDDEETKGEDSDEDEWTCFCCSSCEKTKDDDCCCCSLVENEWICCCCYPSFEKNEDDGCCSAEENEWICSRCWSLEEVEEIGSCCCSPVNYDKLIRTIWMIINSPKIKEASHFFFFAACELKNDWIVPRLESLELEFFSILELDKVVLIYYVWSDRLFICYLIYIYIYINEK